MRKVLAMLFFLFSLSKAEVADTSYIPLYYAFDGILLNSGLTLVHNYGLNSALMVTGTKALIQTGNDWEWNRFAYRHKPLAEFGMNAYYIGLAAPVAVPLSLYGIGLGMEDSKLQTASVAVAQAAIISTILTTSIKAFTGRKHSDVYEGDNGDYSGDFAFGFMKHGLRGAVAGWPSGHAASTWAMAAVLTEFYYSIPLAAGLYGYAFYISTSASLSFHWLSDVCAGALLGYTIGKTVAKHFIKKETQSKYSLVVLPNKVMVTRHF
ncbi:MAG: phosphatase PAP2 family protein [Fibromonadaceae bacterium]|jgi:membrane-associated PAP2 superfamily phosphatase|nr:phosphatase PAP2 family protein [Fibromonadaceae bacterium]